MHKGRQAPKTDVGRGWSVVAANSRPGPLPLHCRSRPAQCTRRGRGWSVLAANSPLPLHLPIEACTMHNVRRAPHHRRRTRLVRLGRRSPALGLFLYTCLIEASQCLRVIHGYPIPHVRRRALASTSCAPEGVGASRPTQRPGPFVLQAIEASPTQVPMLGRGLTRTCLVERHRSVRRRGGMRCHAHPRRSRRRRRLRGAVAHACSLEAGCADDEDGTVQVLLSSRKQPGFLHRHLGHNLHP